MLNEKPAGPTSVSHLHLFFLGWTYYLILPLALGFSGVLYQMEPAAPVIPFFEMVGAWGWPLASYTLLVAVFFLGGSTLAQSFRAKRASRAPSAKILWMLSAVYAILLAAFTAAARELMFSGYSEGADSSATGPIATTAMILAFHYLACKGTGHKSLSFTSGLLLALSAFVLLSMGGRLYVVSILAAIYLNWWRWVAPTRATRIRSLKWILAVPFGLVLVGMWRIGAIEFSTVGFFLSAESIFTSISAMSLMASSSWSFLDTPKDFVSAFLNIVPAAVWPDKADHLVSLMDSSLNFESPFGAISMVTSTIGNFGYIGGLVFMVVVGWINGRAQKNAKDPVSRALYCYLAALIPFEFFRDPMQIQVKLVITGFVLAWVYRTLALPMAAKRPLQGVIAQTA